jgi:hypothetical protein
MLACVEYKSESNSKDNNTITPTNRQNKQQKKGSFSI